MIDLRSDTVTRPSPEMRRAMAGAEVGDDLLDGDPTTQRLEARVADLLGAEDALFFPSGVQANQTALWLHTEPGTEVVLEADAHLVHYEMAGLAALAGAQIRPVPTPDGILTSERARAVWRSASPYVPRASCLAAENTHNAAGGRILPLAAWDGLVALAAEYGVPLHLDGARLWHAAVALDEAPARLARGATTVMVSFSKGLGCPVGSCLAGSRDLIRAGREVRRRLGGAMRQSGILAAAGLYALEHNVERLAHDHTHARLLADGLRDHPAVRAMPPETNIVMIDLLRAEDRADEVVARLADAGVRVVPFGRRRVRAVTHLDVGRDDVRRAADAIGRVLG